MVDASPLPASKGGSLLRPLVDLIGVEPITSWLRTKRSTR